MSKPNVAIVDNGLLTSLIQKIEQMSDRIETITNELRDSKSQYLDSKQVMEMVKHKKDWLNKHKHLIGYKKVKGVLVFKREDVEAYINQSENDYPFSN